MFYQIIFRDDLKTVKDNLKFLGNTQQLLLETFKSFEHYEPFVQKSGNPSETSANENTNVKRPLNPQYNSGPLIPFPSSTLTDSVRSSPFVTPSLSYSPQSIECSAQSNNLPQCAYTPTPSQYYNNQQEQPYPMGYFNNASPPPLPPLPYINEVHEEKKS